MLAEGAKITLPRYCVLCRARLGMAHELIGQFGEVPVQCPDCVRLDRLEAMLSRIEGLLETIAERLR